MNRKVRMLGVLLVALSASIIAAAGVIGLGANQSIGDQNRSLGLTARDPQAIGPLCSVQQASSLIGTQLVSPSSLPSGTSNAEMRCYSDGVALIYTNPSLSTLSEYRNAAIIVLEQKDGSSYSYPSANLTVTRIVMSNGQTKIENVTLAPYLYPTFYNVTVAGHPGWGYDPVSSKGIVESGRLDWWNGDVHYIILGQMPVKAILQIASSMYSP